MEMEMGNGKWKMEMGNAAYHTRHFETLGRVDSMASGVEVSLWIVPVTLMVRWTVTLMATVLRLTVTVMVPALRWLYL